MRYLGPDPDAWRLAVEGLSVELVLVGHTHVPFDFQFGQLHVLNPVERAVGALTSSGLDPGAFEALAALLQTGTPPLSSLATTS